LFCEPSHSFPQRVIGWNHGRQKARDRKWRRKRNEGFFPEKRRLKRPDSEWGVPGSEAAERNISRREEIGWRGPRRIWSLTIWSEKERRGLLTRWGPTLTRGGGAPSQRDSSGLAYGSPELGAHKQKTGGKGAWAGSTGRGMGRRLMMKSARMIGWVLCTVFGWFIIHFSFMICKKLVFWLYMWWKIGTSEDLVFSSQFSSYLIYLSTATFLIGITI
jgi:hypothetical protein